MMKAIQTGLRAAGRVRGSARVSGRARGFTLIELLVVILIIAVMLAMMFPAITAIRRASQVRKAGGDAQLLANAIKQYYSSYKTWPNQIQGSADTTYSGAGQKALIDKLLDNPRGTVFLEIPAGSYVDGCFVDPWGNPYVVAVDENDDNVAAVNSAAFSPAMTTNVPSTVAVASWGRDPDSDDDAAEKIKRRVYSWMQ